MEDDTPVALRALRVDEAKLIGHVDEVVRASVEETLNGLTPATIGGSCARIIRSSGLFVKSEGARESLGLSLTATRL